MFIYIILLFLLLFGVFHFDYRGVKILKGGYYFFIFILFTLLTGLRYRVGGDALAYEDYFYAYPDLSSYFSFLKKGNISFEYQPLYILFVAICKSLNPDYYFYQLIHAFIVNTVIFWFIKKNTQFVFTTVLILYLFLFYFYFTFDIQREILAICCFLLGFKYFKNNNWPIFYIFAIIAFFFHISAFFLLLLPFFKLIKITREFIIISIIISIPIIISKAVFLDYIKLFLFTESMQNKGESYAKVDFSIKGIIFYYSIRVLTIVPFLFYYSKNKIQEDKQDWLLSAIFIVSIISQLMVGSDRFNNYLYIPFIIFLVNFIFSKKYYHKANISKRVLLFTVYVFLFSVTGIKLFVGNFKNNYYYNVFFPYSHVFDKERNPDREKFMYYLWKQ